MKTKLALPAVIPNHPQIPLTLEPTLDKFRELSEEAPKHFLGMRDTIPYMVATLLGGQHCLLMGKPGTAKTKVTEFLMKSLLPNHFFKSTLSSDIGQEDLSGPMKMTELARDMWLRKWSGMANKEFVFLDEIGTAPDFVVNKIKEAMVSRASSTVDEEHQFPLHSVFAGSNETLVDNPAVWDRFNTRIVLQPVTNVHDLWEIITGNTNPIDLHIDASVLPSIRLLIQKMVFDMDSNIQVKDAWKNQHTQITQKWELSPTARRLTEGFNIVAAWALLEGRAHIEPQDLIPFRFVYPHDPKHPSYREIQNYYALHYGNQVDTVNSDLQNMMRELRDQVARTNMTDRASSVATLTKIRTVKLKYGQGGTILNELNEMELTVQQKLGSA